MTPEPVERIEFAPGLDRDLLALASDLEIQAGELIKPEGVEPGEIFERVRSTAPRLDAFAGLWKG